MCGGSCDNSSCTPRTPGNPTEVDAIVKVSEVVNAPRHTNVKGSTVAVTVTSEIMT